MSQCMIVHSKNTQLKRHTIAYKMKQKIFTTIGISAHAPENQINFSSHSCLDVSISLPPLCKIEHVHYHWQFIHIHIHSTFFQNSPFPHYELCLAFCFSQWKRQFQFRVGVFFNNRSKSNGPDCWIVNNMFSFEWIK